MPLIDSTPPPLPANPPPSSVASFAATTMAPETTDASLANTADNAIPPPPPPSDPITTDNLDEPTPKSENELTSAQPISNEAPLPINDVSEESSVLVAQTPQTLEENEPKETRSDDNVPLEDKDVPTDVEDVVNTETAAIEESIINKDNEETSDNTEVDIPAPPSEVLDLPEDEADVPNSIEDLPSPPSPICEDVDDVIAENDIIKENIDNTQVPIPEANEILINSNHISEVVENSSSYPEKDVVNDNALDAEKALKTKSKDSLGNLIETIECNGNVEHDKLITENEIDTIPPTNPKEIATIESGRTMTPPEESLPPPVSEAGLPPPPAQSGSPPASPQPPADAPAATPQEPLAVSDKLAELIPEVPDVPELKTETLQETTSDVAVAN
ncbi:uncharacterized protein LOC113497167 isoform X1 [Trichoplusia ni]|uniref:Uncharacterized protein LOC113497167 isoform X1 n=1 Tax=Trichoplusia ni TaxID=7111 RepID=A0A7E5VVL1_TRINI|nr:uncharacterized protein LOC113497167 isoform X1 [Trichoplusia ni]